MVVRYGNGQVKEKMSDIEKKWMDQLVKHKDLLFFVIISILGMVMRQQGRDFISADMRDFLIPWYDSIKAQGGLRSLKEQVGDYNLLYQTLVAFMTYLPGSCVQYYKALSIVFDYWLAFASALLVARLSGEACFHRKFQMTYAVVLLLPTVVLNSVYWGQCDSIYTTFLVLTLLFFYEEKYISGFVMLGMGFACKLQTIFILPFLVGLYFYKKNFSLSGFLVSLAVFWGSGIVAFLCGRSVTAPFTIYLDQTGLYQKMYLNVSSFWTILNGVDYAELGTFAVILAVALCGMELYQVMSGKVRIDTGEAFVKTSGGFLWTCILFLPAMHERYTYPLDILLILLAFLDRRYWKYVAVSVLLSLTTYGDFLFGGGSVNRWNGVIYVVAWISFMLIIDTSCVKK